MLEQIGAAHVDATASARAAIDKIDLGDAEVVVVVSPHGGSTGIYSKSTGSLDDFGVPGITFSFVNSSEVVEELAGRWKQPLIDEPIDYGCGVPAMLLAIPLPTVMCTLAGEDSNGGVTRARDEGRRLADALSGLDGRVFVVASAHGAAGIGPRAPLGQRAGAEALDAQVVQALDGDAGKLQSIPPHAWNEAGACGAGPLATWAHLFAGRESELLSYSHPFGVGYFVARVG